jgi:hypothetical protein
MLDTHQGTDPSAARPEPIDVDYLPLVDKKPKLDPGGVIELD